MASKYIIVNKETTRIVMAYCEPEPEPVVKKRTPAKKATKKAPARRSRK